MRLLLLAAAVIAATTMLALSFRALPRAQAASVCPANPSPVNAADPSMVVVAPRAGATVLSPVTVAGRARAFEANVRITIFDAGGSVLADTSTTASEAAPALAPYSTGVSFVTTAEQKGCVRVFEESAQDGQPVNVVQVEVSLAAPTTPPSAGTAGLQDESGSARHLALYAAGALALLGALALAIQRRLWT
jgi:hypothetical protein